MNDWASIIPGNYQRRPGPFGPAWALLPKDQPALILEDKTLASDAIERMVDSGYSQIPVMNGEGRIIGVFSWQSFGKRVADLHATKIKPTELPIREAMEPARFIGREVYIDTETDWGDIDHILVGTEDDLLGVLGIADVFGQPRDGRCATVTTAFTKIREHKCTYSCCRFYSPPSMPTPSPARSLPSKTVIQSSSYETKSKSKFGCWTSIVPNSPRHSVARPRNRLLICALENQ